MINKLYYTDIPTWDKDHWTTTSFETLASFTEFVDAKFKEPGKYKFTKETNEIFNSQARVFQENKFYIDAPYKSRDFIDYWDFEKSKCRKGVIIRTKTDEFYLTRAYYMWLNFLPIFDKIDNKYDFARIWDTQYHMRLYDFRAVLHGLNSVCMKKRQIAYSYQMCAEMITEFWFEEGAICKIGASDKGFISDEGSWKYLNEYRDFLNTHTAWYRPTNPGTPLHWEQKEEETSGGKSNIFGLKSMIIGKTFEKSPTKGVGGRCKKFWYEEGGIAPTASKTYKYVQPALKQGQIVTGTFYIGGSVGELDKCDPLKEFMMRPAANKFLGVEHNLIDSTGKTAVTGLFIPEQWSMPPHIDEYGNSLVDQALKALDEYFAQLKIDLEPDLYQLEVSQHPRNIEEAFAARKESKFPLHILQAQETRIKNKEYPALYIDLEYDEHGKLEPKPSKRIPISEFPISKDTVDKRGCLVVWEKPSESPQFGEYYGSIDPVSEGRTTSSDSLCSIFIYRSPIEVTTVSIEGTTTHIEGDKLVASWTGRYDDINETHEYLRKIIEWYNAWTIVENNISLFINYMILKKRQKYLVPKDQILFLKELGYNNTVQAEYGWKNTGRIFKDHLLSYGIEFVKEVISEDFKDNGSVILKHYGVERIPDIMLIKEMKAYVEGLNVDRLVAYCALVAFVKVQMANKGYTKKRVNKDNLDNQKDLYKLNKHMFKNIGASSDKPSKFKRSAFKNIR